MRETEKAFFGMILFLVLMGQLSTSVPTAFLVGIVSLGITVAMFVGFDVFTNWWRERKV